MEAAKMGLMYMLAILAFILVISLLGMWNSERMFTQSVECLKVGGAMHNSQCVGK